MKRVESIEPSLACNQLYTESGFSLSLTLSASSPVWRHRERHRVDTVAKSLLFTLCKASKAQNKYLKSIDDPRKPCQVLTKPSSPAKPGTSTRSAQSKSERSSSNIRHRSHIFMLNWINWCIFHVDRAWNDERWIFAVFKASFHAQKSFILL